MIVFYLSTDMKLKFWCKQGTTFVAGIAIAFSVGGCRESAFAAQSQQAGNFQTFADWCVNKEKLTADAKHTVEVLLEKANTQNCQAANQNLVNVPALDFSDN
jgi:internalin A